MPQPADRDRYLIGCLVIAIGLVVSACQSGGTAVLDSVAGAPAQPNETLGAGSTAVSLLVPRSAAGILGREARDIRDGASLALEDVGQGKLALTVHDTGSSANAAALTNHTAHARIVVGPADAASVSTLASLPGHPPAIVFLGNGGPRGNGIFALETDAIDSALEAARIVAGAGRKSFMAVLPQGFAQADKDRLARGLTASGAKLLGSVEYSATNVTDQIAQQREALAKSQGVIVFGSGTAPAAVAAALRKAEALAPGAPLIGNLTWASDNFARPEIEGALIAMPDQAALNHIADRYLKKTGRTLSMDAAYGYDALAIVAGIVRSIGPDALTAATLTKSSGFRGTTGIFRFGADGSVDRLLALYKVSSGTLQLLDAAPDGF